MERTCNLLDKLLIYFHGENVEVLSFLPKLFYYLVDYRKWRFNNLSLVCIFETNYCKWKQVEIIMM